MKNLDQVLATIGMALTANLASGGSWTLAGVSLCATVICLIDYAKRPS